MKGINKMYFIVGIVILITAKVVLFGGIINKEVVRILIGLGYGIIGGLYIYPLIKKKDSKEEN